jgi:hypothetical protein
VPPGQNDFRKSQLIRPDSERDKPYLFFDQLDEGNTMVQSNLAFEELALAGLEPARPVLAGPASPNRYFFVRAPNDMF